MAGTMDRRTFLAAAAGGALASAKLLAAPGAASTQPAGAAGALEWRNKQAGMAYAKLGRTNFMTSRAVFGAGGVRGPDDMKLLEYAIERGVNYIDTGRAYKNSESNIGQVLKRDRARCFVVSKAGHIGWPDMTIKPGQDAAAAKLYSEQLDQSLKALNVETIDCYMVQGVEDDWVVTLDSVYDAFTKAKKAGKVRYYGLSTHKNVGKICETAAASGRCDVIMLAVNPNSLKELSPSIAAMRKAGIGVVSMKTSGPIGKDPKAYDAHYEQLFAGQELSPYQRAYAYLLARGGVDAFISNTPNRKILDENLAAAAMKLEKAELDRLEDRVLSEAAGSCHHCGRCERACPSGNRPADLLRCHAYLHTYGDAEMARGLYAQLVAAGATACTGCRSCQHACPEAFDLPGVIAGLGEQFAV
jgi:aryl-alcohol dehydrogenase-like predicted oxidoreductase